MISTAHPLEKFSNKTAQPIDVKQTCFVANQSCFYVGVVSRDFELSSQPNLGTWRITVQIDVRGTSVFSNPLVVLELE
jgi:hypothetical protein